MLILTGYHHFVLKVDELRNATATNNPYAKIGTRGEANSWFAKADIPGAHFKKEGAVGVLCDKFGFWYLTDLAIKGDSISFEVVKADSAERYSFKMEKKSSGEYWGQVSSLRHSAPERWSVNCVVAETPTLFIPTQGIPDDMLIPPPRSGLH